MIFPLFLRLSDLAETPEEIIDAIPVLIQRDYSETATQVMELLREKLKVGKCLLLLDALDEVPTEHRKRLTEKLNRFAQRKSPCPIICTSRIVGYGGALLAGVKEVEIVPFSQKQIEQYIETWFRNAAGYLNDDGEQYLFLHRTFQEYLTACYLKQARDSIALAKAHFWE